MKNNLAIYTVILTIIFKATETCGKKFSSKFTRITLIVPSDIFGNMKYLSNRYNLDIGLHTHVQGLMVEILLIGDFLIISFLLTFASGSFLIAIVISET